MRDGLLETEIKLRTSDPTAARKLLAANGFRVVRDRVFEANSVFDLPDGSLRTKGQLLRLRQAGEQITLTWKGPEIPGRHKSRPETEVGVTDFDSCSRLLQDLGYLLVFRYDKYRTEFQSLSPSGVATIDETPIGTFLELEGKSDWIDQTAAGLGFTQTDYILASYGTIYRNYCEEHSIVPSFMQFTRNS